jgi:hypothetical protein
MVKVSSEQELKEITDSIAIRITGDPEDPFFSQKDIIKVLEKISEVLTDFSQREAFGLAIHFIEHMGE